MNFTDFTYSRPEMDIFTQKFKALIDEFEQAVTFSDQDASFAAINDLRADFNSMYNICYIRHTIDTKDEFYEKENNFFDEQTPNFQALNTDFYKKLLQSKFRKELQDKWGDQIFTIAELSLKTFAPSILDDLKEENRLSSEYVKIKAGAKILFRGEEYNLSSIVPLEGAKDRETRQKATEAKWGFFAEHEEKVGEIFDQLVKVRHRIALKLGYRNFVELGYVRMLRSDYDASMVANFRKQVEEYIVPLATKLYERQRKRLGLPELKFYDEDFRFQSGNPQPKGNPSWILSHADEMYAQLSPETHEFFCFMRDNNLMDLEAKSKKATGGYCTYIDNYKAPYIFSNFNGTSADIDVLTHEAGHAFQVYSSRELGVREYTWPTFEACEIHSMSMEFFTWPWMHLFFKEDTDKYRFSHLSNAICFLPYGVAVDEFQHYVYENPEVGPAQRNKAWREIEKKYLPHRDYDGNKFLEGGGFWHKQSHIFSMPFYYIDYTLAQICAFQFWKKDRENHQNAWTDYLRLCRAGGSLSFLELVELANLQSPFKDDTVQSVIGVIEKWLEEVDDGAF